MRDKTILKLYAIKFFHNLIPAYVIERLFWAERGMTTQTVVYAEIIYALVIVITEIPTGIFADRFGKRQMLRLSAVLACLELLILIHAHQFWHFAVAMLLAGLSGAASSGTEQAFLYTALKKQGLASQYEKYVGRLNVFDFTSAILAALCGGFLAARFGYLFNYWISLAAMGIALAITWSLGTEAHKVKALDQTFLVFDYVTNALHFFKRHPAVFIVLFSGMLTGGALNFLDEFWQLIADAWGIPVPFFGLLFTLFMTMRLPGNLIAHSIKKYFSFRSVLLLGTAIITVGFFYIAFVQNLSALAAICAVYLTFGVLEPLTDGYLQHHADDQMRATLTSFVSLGNRGIIALIGLAFGYVTTRVDLFSGYTLIAALCALYWIFLWRSDL